MILPFLLAFAGAQAAAVPDYVGAVVPETHSVVICPSASAAGRMLVYYYRPGPFIIETERFFEGLRATGCTQEAGPVTVRRVRQMRVFTFPSSDQPQTHIRFEGETADGAPVHAIVDVEAFRVRTPLEEFLLIQGSDGVLALDENSWRCPTPDAARAVLRGVPDDRPEAERQATFARLVRDQGCAPAQGEFRIVDAFESIGFDDDYEGHGYRALAAVQGDGPEIGLIFHESL